MTKLIFVHGTGTRDPSFSQSVLTLKSQMSRELADIVPCNWGKVFGTTLQGGGASIPAYEETRGTLDEVDLWGLLYQDPFYELRIEVAKSSEGQDRLMRRDPNNSPRIDVALKELCDRQVHTILNDPVVDIEPYIPAAASYLRDSISYRELVEREVKDMESVVARSIVAVAINLFIEEQRHLPASACDPSVRKTKVDSLTKELTMSTRSMGILSSLLEVAMYGLMTGSSWWGRNNRGFLLNEVSPIAGDILYYQAHGSKIRTFIEEMISSESSAGEPLVLLAHSLGGVACVEALIEKANPAVKLLITVGSQAPYFYEIGALTCFPYSTDTPLPHALPEPFPHWVNIYDLRDFLSFIGGNLFGSRVIDIPVNNHQPFPYSHLSYWNNPKVINYIKDQIEKLTKNAAK